MASKQGRSILPNMNDYYYDCTDSYNLLDLDRVFSTTSEADPSAAKFYSEEPPELGYDEQYKVATVKYYKSNDGISQSDKHIVNGIKIVDGDTSYFNVENMEFGDTTTEKYIKEITNDNMKIFTSSLGMDSSMSSKDGVLVTRFAFIDTGELPHFEPVGKVSYYSGCEVKSVKYSELNSNDYLYAKHKSFIEATENVSFNNNTYNGAYNKDKDSINVIKFNGKWSQYFDKDGYRYVLISKDESQNSSIVDAGIARDMVVTALNEAEEIRISINLTTLTKSNKMEMDKYKTLGKDDVISSLIQVYEGFTGDMPVFMGIGFNALGLDTYGRAVSVIFAKVNGKWVNVNKLVIAKTRDTTINTSFTMSDKFDADSYNYSAKTYSDNLYNSIMLMDDRYAVHGKIFSGTPYDELRTWTVAIGDCMLFVPPTSIRKINQTKSTFLKPMRSKGKIFDNAHKSEHFLELDLFFNEDRGINGYEYEATLPNGKKTTYYLNGLRSLVAQFKVCPFLPIDNDYINNQLHMYAVSMVSLTVNTVPSFPKLYKATLQLADFDYRVYMPEIPWDEDDIYGDKNYFAKQINFSLMRYYYQRLIQNGEAIKDLEFNSDEYNEKYFGGSEYYMHTCLQPMKFNDSKIIFYVPNKESLDIKKSQKIQSLNQATSNVKLDQNDKNIASEVAKLYKALSAINSGDSIKKLKSFHNDSDKYLYRFRCGLDLLTYISSLEDLEVVTIEDGRFTKTNEAAELHQTIRQVTDECIARFKECKSVDGTPLCSDFKVSYKYSFDEDDDTYILFDAIVKFKFEIDYVGREGAYAKLKSEATKSSSTGYASSPDEVFPENQVEVKISLRLKNAGFMYTKTQGVANYSEAGNISEEEKVDFDANFYVAACKESSNWKIDLDKANLKFIALCTSIDSNGEISGITDGGEIRATLDWETVDSIEFDQYNTGDDLVVTACSASISNSFSQITLQQTDGYAPQFMGGSETEIRLTMMTQSKEVVSQLELLPALTADYARQYHIILSQWTLKINCEFTNFFGVNEVIIDTVSVKTVPNYPNLYQIDMIMYSTDRALRNRESLKGKDLQNFKNIYMSGQSVVRTWEYQQINDMLSETELYPDLELPSLKELREAGFEFLRYTNEKRVYPDPDFYFTYAHALVSQMIREVVLNGLADMATDSVDITSTADGLSLKNVDMKKKPEEYLSEDMMAKMRKVYAVQGYSKEDIDSTSNVLQFICDKDNSIEQIWNICPDIKIILCEKNAASQLASVKTMLYQNGGESVAANDKNAINGATTQGDYCWAKWNDEVYVMNSNIDKYLKVKINDRHNSRTDRGITSFDKDTYKNNSYVRDDYVSICKCVGVGVVRELDAKLVNSMFKSAACAASGKQEFTKSSDDDRWKPTSNYIEYSTGAGYPSYTTTVSDIEAKDADGKYKISLSSITAFGPYRMKLYTKKEMESLLDEDLSDNGLKSEEKIYLLDPYYRNLSEEDKRQYIKKCCNSSIFAELAFFRISLLYMKKMAKHFICPSFSYDLLRHLTTNEDKIKEILTSLKVENSTNLSETYSTYFKNNSRAIDAGKLFIAILCALCDKEQYFFNLLKNREYDKLDAMTKSCMLDAPSIKTGSVNNIVFRKFIRALIGCEAIESVDIGTAGKGNSDTLSTIINKGLDDEIVRKASEDPKTYMQHSFYDMITHDCRGRMLRAFPTYYMVFIDEGRKIGAWKLHDNFYTTSSISEITVSKSRKIAADTAQVTMSNFFNTFTADDEDANRSYVNNYSDVFMSIFTPKISEYAQDMEALRTAASPVERVRLRPGIRMQIRLGYGSDASVMPVTFNGCITEVETKDVVTFVAQGDGVELSKPIIYDKDASDLEYDNNLVNWCDSGTTPANILRNLLNSNGSFLNDELKGTRFEQVSDYIGTPTNPYGIFHFGEPRFKYIHDVGEPCQNIYEGGSARPEHMQNSNNDSTLDEYFSAQKIEINFHLAGKTVWDVMQICKSPIPDYIAAVMPFSFRSSIFFGRPHDYCAYAYTNSNGTWYEKRKPFQQYHIYTSETDIVANYVSASMKDFKTCCVGVYEKQGSFGSKDVEHTQPIWVDKSIYPEFQRTFYYDTKYYGKGGRTFGPVSGVFDWVFGSITQANLLDRNCDESGEVKNHHSIATRMATNALKESVYDMYQGPIVVIGDPTVKPHDRIYIADSYNEMNGCVLVRDVVETISYETGYTTSIYPDLIATTAVDAKRETYAQNMILPLVSVMSLNFALFRAISAAQKMLGSVELGDELSKKLASAVGDAKTKIYESVQSSAKYKKVATKVKGALDTIKPLKNILSGAKAVANSPAGKLIAGVSRAGAVWGAVAFLAIGYAYDWIVSEIRNSRAITLFPLKKYGRPMVVGVDGNKSLIYGSPSYNAGDEGLMGNVIQGASKWFESLPKSGIIGSVFYSLMEDNGLLKAAKNYNHDYLEQNMMPEETVQDIMGKANSSNLNLFSKTEVNMTLPRVDIKNSNEMYRIVKNFGVQEHTIEEINNNKNMQNMKQVIKEARLAKYIKNGFFVVGHESANFNSGTDSNIVSVDINLGGMYQVTVNSLKKESADGDVYDLPFLHSESLPILSRLVDLAHRKTVGTHKTNDSDTYNTNMAGTQIVLVSALKAGSTKNYESTGYSFVLQCTNDRAYTALKQAIKSIQDECTKAGNTEGIFSVSTNDSTKKVFIVVRMSK